MILKIGHKREDFCDRAIYDSTFFHFYHLDHLRKTYLFRLPRASLKEKAYSLPQQKPARVPKRKQPRVDQRQPPIAFFDDKNQRASQVLPGCDIAALKHSLER